MTISLTLTPEKAQRLSNLLDKAITSSDNLGKFSGAMPFSLSECGVDEDAISDALYFVAELLEDHLPEPADEDDESGDDEDYTEDEDE